MSLDRPGAEHACMGLDSSVIAYVHRYAYTRDDRFDQAVAKGDLVVNLDRAVFAFAGIVVLAGLALGLAFSPWWLLLSAFAGLNMFQAAFTGFCPSALVMKRLGLRPGQAFD